MGVSSDVLTKVKRLKIRPSRTSRQKPPSGARSCWSGWSCRARGGRSAFRRPKNLRLSTPAVDARSSGRPEGGRGRQHDVRTRRGSVRRSRGRPCGHPCCPAAGVGRSAATTSRTSACRGRGGASSHADAACAGARTRSWARSRKQPAHSGSAGKSLKPHFGSESIPVQR